MRHHHRLQPVNLLEFVGLGVGRAGHPGQLRVKAKVILEGDRSQRLILRLDAHAFFGLYCLVQAITPATPRHQAPGELIDDDDFTFLHHVVLVAVVQMISPQCRVQVVHQRDIGRVVERGTFGDEVQTIENLLRTFMTLLGQEHLLAFLIQREVSGLGNTLARARVGLALLAG